MEMGLGPEFGPISMVTVFTRIVDPPFESGEQLLTRVYSSNKYCMFSTVDPARTVDPPFGNG